MVVGASTFTGCGAALYVLYETVITETLGGLLSLLSMVAVVGDQPRPMFWLPLLIAGAAVLVALAINVASLWWSQTKPRGGHYVFQMFALAGTMVTLVFTLYISVSVVLMHYPELLHDPFGTQAAADKREGEAALAAERAREQAHRLEMEERNAKIERERAMRKQ